jgi:hypothetical protein
VGVGPTTGDGAMDGGQRGSRITEGHMVPHEGSCG